MRIDLGPLPYRKAMELVRWCAENDIDRERAIALIEGWAIPANVIEDEEWFLDIPEQYMTYFMLKWAK